MPWQAVVLWTLFGLCVEGCVITWRLTDPAFDNEVSRRQQAELLAEWLKAENDGLHQDRRLLRQQVLSAGLVPIVDRPARPRALRAPEDHS